MKNILGLFLASSMALTAQAQNNSTTTATIAPAAGTTTTTAETAPKEAAKAWSIAFVSQNTVGVQAGKELGSQAAMVSSDYVSIGFKLSERAKISAFHNFGIVNNFNNFSEEEKTILGKAGFQEGYFLLDPAVGYSVNNVSKSILGSDPVSLAFRYYLPATQASQTRNTAGTLRADSSIDWTINPKWSVSYVLSPRISFSNTLEGGQVYRMIHMVAPSYNFSDKFSGYGSAGFDTKAKQANNRLAVVSETLELEIGANVLLNKSLVLNPTISESVSTRESFEVGRADQASYNLNLQAAF